VAIECHGERAPCETVAERLEGEGVEAAISETAPRGSLRLLVGPWEQLRDDEVAAQLDRGPATSGVFARFADDRSGLVALDPAAEPAAAADSGTGLVAALRLGERPATWLVTGAEPAAVDRAAEALDSETLADRYAIAVTPAETVALPAAVNR
jgi:hypothetical protein